MGASANQPVTSDELIRHRLKELEDLATGWRAAERRVDGLVLQLAAVEKTATSIETEVRALAQKTDGSLSRLHQRLDETLREQAREEGREEGRLQMRAEAFEEGRERGVAEGEKKGLRETLRVVAWTVGATIATSGVVVALLALILKH